MGHEAPSAPSNIGTLAWFIEGERHVCGSCDMKACVSLSEATSSFCLACGAVSIEGVRVDVDRRIAT